MMRASNIPVFRPILRRWDDAELRRAARYSKKLCGWVPDEVPLRRDLTWRELRSIVPGILAAQGSQDLGGLLLPVFETVCRPSLDVVLGSPAAHLARASVPVNFIALTGLCAACNSALLPAGLPALAWAVIIGGSWWRLPRRAAQRMLQSCARSEWDSVAAILTVTALREALRRRPSFALWRRLLAGLSASSDWSQLLSQAGARSRCLAAARKGILRNEGDAFLLLRLERVAHEELILAAELIGRAYCELERFDKHTARHWFLPLVERATGRYIDRTTAARFLCDNLRKYGPIRAEELAKAMERGIAPLSQDDYSNFRKAFSMNSWELMRGGFTHWAIVTELERFAAEEDRVQFWRYFESVGAPR